MDTHSNVAIGQRVIGPGHPVYIIAEAGVNHNGNPTEALRLIDAAKDAGADGVKFQIFCADELVTSDASACAYQQDATGDTGQKEMLRRLELSVEQFAELRAYADRLGIDFLATPFGITELHALVDLSVPAIKIASPDIVNVPLLTAAAATGLPLIVSTGASDLAEVDAAVDQIRGERAGDRLILLHCVSAYPTLPIDARLACIRTLSQRYALPVGFSDHTADSAISSLAVAAGALVLEKHLTLDRSAIGPDHFFSLTPPEFARYVAAARQAQACLGEGLIACSEPEREVRRLARGSIVSTMTIRPGTRLTADMLTVRRPGDGIAPREWERVLRCLAKTDIPSDTPLAWHMLDTRSDKPAHSHAEAK